MSDDERHHIEDSDAHLRCAVVPAQRLQEFLEESARAAGEGLFTPRGRPRGRRGPAGRPRARRCPNRFAVC